MSQVPFPARTATISGGGVTTVFSGVGVLLGVLINPLSGASPSYSGILINVQDATSGMFVRQSGNAIFVNLDFGLQSGLLNGINVSLNNGFVTSQNLQYIEGFCNSGLVASVSGTTQFNLTVLYNK